MRHNLGKSITYFCILLKIIKNRLIRNGNLLDTIFSTCLRLRIKHIYLNQFCISAKEHASRCFICNMKKIYKLLIGNILFERLIGCCLNK